MATLERGDWAHLPRELLESIAARITQIRDLVRFSSVCLQWRSAAKSVSGLHPPQFPWLLLPSDQPTTTNRLFFNLADNRTYIPLPNAKSVHSSGADGLIIPPQGEVTLALFNPLLQPMTECTKNWAAYRNIKAKVFGSDLFAACFANIGDIFLCKPGASSWRRTEGEHFNECTDFVCHDGRLYAEKVEKFYLRLGTLLERSCLPR